MKLPREYASWVRERRVLPGERVESDILGEVGVS